MGRNWTEDQKRAIYESGTNIIVSAGAGSGKTAVLTERVTEKLRNGISIRSLLILTFTNAAASEMKERIRKEVKKEPNLKEQLDALDSAYITTFDSYALSLVKKYHYLLNISKDIKITSSSIISLKRKDFLDEILEEEYEKKDPKFVKFIHSFCLKNDQNIRNAILKFDDKLNLRTDKNTFLKNYLDTYYSDDIINSYVESYIVLIKEKIESLKKQLDELELICDGDYFYTLKDALDPFMESDEYEVWKGIKDVKLKSVPRGSAEEVKKGKKELADTVKEIVELLTYESPSVMKEQILMTKDFLGVITNILMCLDEKVRTWKEVHQAFEFHDISRMSLELLKNHEDIRTSLKNSFSEILVDEYQDTNDIQEEFISYISNNNVYMVGDIKQSIYQFRNANPYIFKNKYDNYRNHLGGEKIDLIKNFRSRKEVLADINTLFIPIMDNEVGGADYEKEHQMVPGNIRYDELGTTGEDYHMDILNYTYDKESPYSRREIEIFAIAKDIKDKIEAKYPIFNMDEGTVRPCEYRDFTILLQTGSDYDLYKKIFLYLGIPIQVYQDETIKTSYDVHIIKNIFILLSKMYHHEIDNTFKRAYMSVGRSFLMEIPDSELYDVIKNNRYKETELYQKCLELLPLLTTCSLNEILSRIITTFDIWNKIIKVGDINHTLIRLDYLKEVASEVSSLGLDIDEFITILDEVLNGEEDIKMKGILDDSNTVKLMNIHKSKGLEFPICYFASLDRTFNTDDVKGDFLYDKELGFILPFYQDGLRDTIVKTLYKDHYLKEMISERIRLFYVAVTRAKEKMIIVTDLSLKENVDAHSVPVLKKLGYRSLNDMICSMKEGLDEYIKPLSLDSLKLSKDYMLELKVDLSKKIPSTNEEIIEHSIKVKTDEVEEKHYSKVNHELWEENLNEILSLGRDVHLILETLDFKNPNLDFIKNEYIKEKIEHFLNNPLLKNIEEATIYQEFPIFENNAKGIIDLFLVYEEHIDLIDYKLKNVSDPSYITQVKAYQTYLEESFEKPVNGYLYSIFEEKLIEVK